MSLLSHKEFAAAVKRKPGTFKSDKSRYKLVTNDAGLFDTEHPVNKAYINKVTDGKGVFYEVAPVANSDASGDKGAGKAAPVLSDREQLMLDTDQRQKIANAQKAEQEAELKRIQLEKAAGNLLPVDLVQKIFVINLQSIFKTFEGEHENIASIYTEIFGGGREELSQIIERSRQVIANAIEKSSEAANAEIEIAIREYQDERNRGERK